MLKGAFIATLACIWTQGASSADCEFVSRANVGALAKDLPVQVIGWVTCDPQAHETSSFVVSQFTKLDDATLESYAVKLSAQMDSMTRKTELTWRSNQPLDKRQLIVKTTGPTLKNMSPDVMVHYVFVAPVAGGAKLVFMHSIAERQSNRLRNKLDALHSELSRPQFTSTILTPMIADR